MTSAELDAHWNFGDPRESEARFRALGGDEARTQAARALGLRGRFAEADTLLDGLAEASPLVQMRAVLERGRLRNSSGDAEAAKPLFYDALERAQALGTDYYAIDAAHMLGIVEGEGWTRRAIAMAKESPDRRARGWLGSLYNNLGWSLHDAERYEEALEAFQTAVECRREFGQTDRLTSAEWCVARCLRSLGRVEEALVILERLLLVAPDSPYVQEEIAACRGHLNRPV
ncbi:hypothetical protein BH11ARM2_BH11ARM2_00740 [soil metagenome]